MVLVFCHRKKKQTNPNYIISSMYGWSDLSRSCTRNFFHNFKLSKLRFQKKKKNCVVSFLRGSLCSQNRTATPFQKCHRLFDDLKICLRFWFFGRPVHRSRDAEKNLTSRYRWRPNRTYSSILSRPVTVI